MELLVSLWRNYSALVDLALYFFVFAATARAALARVFPGREGKVLAVSVGLMLAASLVLTQEKLGFSLERLGPAAAFVLCMIVLAVAYRLMHHARVPLPLLLLLSGLLGLVLLRATLPDMTGRFAREYSGFALLGLIGVLAWAWQGSESQAESVERRRPGKLLARQHVLPNQEQLDQEKVFIKRQIRKPTRQDLKDEVLIEKDAKKVNSLLETENTTSKEGQKAAQILDDALQRVKALRRRSQNLLKLDDSLRRFDLGWLRKADIVDLGQLTPTQQLVLRKSVADERNRLDAEGKLGELEAQVSRFSDALEERVQRARDFWSRGDAAGAQAWIAEAQALDLRILELDAKALTWEKRLLKFLRRQVKELSEVS